MRKISIILTALLFISAMNAQDLKVIKLNAPDKARGTAVMKAFSDRHSDREYAAKELSAQDLSDLLWAANGINRTDGKRTAPSALNKQDIDVYVIMKDGAYLYDAKAHALNPIAKGDHRAAVGGGQDFVKDAPVCLVLVSDLSRFGNVGDHTKLMAAMGRYRFTKYKLMLCWYRIVYSTQSKHGSGRTEKNPQADGQPGIDDE